MKKCLIGFIIVLVSIIPISTIKASFDVELKNGTSLSFADLPVNDGDEYVILKNSNNQYYLFSHNSSNRYFSLRTASNTHFELEFTAISALTDTYKMYVYDGTNWNDRTSNSRYNGSCSGSCYWQYSSSLAYGTINADKRFVQVVYSTNDLTFNSDSSSNYTFISNSNFDVSTWLANDIVYYKNENNVPIEYISYDLEENFSDYGSYYDVKIYTSNYDENYTYKYKFDFQNEFNDISSYLDNEGFFNYTLLNNGTLYLAVYDENDDLIHSETYTFSDITYSLEKPTPSVSIDVNYNINNDNFASANITFNFSNYSPNYSYYYSFNDIEDIYISDEDIIDNKFNITTYQNCTIYFYIYNSDGVPIYRTTKRITEIIDNGGYFYYTFDMNDFYNSDNNTIKTLVFYYENQKLLKNNETLLPYFNFYLLGEDNQLLPFYIKYNNEVIDVNTFTRNVNFDGLLSSYLPYELKFDDFITYHYKSYTTFAVAPVMNLVDYTFYDYNDYKLVIRTTKELFQDNFSFRDNVIIPLPDVNNDLSDYNEKYNFIASIFNKFLEPIKNTFPIFWQIGDIFFNLNFDNGEGDLPPVLVDFSFLGVNKQLNVIDFSYFLEYRPYLWGLYKIIIGFWTIRNVVRNFKLGGD